jgi:hypothetical protein
MHVNEALTTRAADLPAFDIIGLKLSFQTPASEALDIIEQLRRRVAGADTRLVYFDGDDDLNVQWPEMLEKVDLYVKKHVFADPAAYLRTYIGKTNLTDYVARTHGVSFADDIIPSSGNVSPTLLRKLHLGWNIGLDDKIASLSQTPLPHIDAPKDIDVTCRAMVPPSIWTFGLRAPAADRLESLAGRYRIESPRTRVAQAEYNAEMARSKICVSPFGFGEICWRDFEAICFGCLLVKPDMSHIKTSPNIFEPGVTYAPVKWDYSDLNEVCTHYLERPEERLKIVHEARERLLAALSADWFADRFGEFLSTFDAVEKRPIAAS